MTQTTYDLGRGLTLTRTFDAPPDAVFQAWTEPQHLTWFFNPGMPTAHETTVDLREGGHWRQHMVVNAETQYITGGIYHEVVPNKKLVFTWGAVGGWPDLDLDLLADAPLVTLTFRPLPGERTQMVLHVQLADQMTEARAHEWMTCGMADGWSMTIDRLSPYLSGARAA